MRYPTLGAGLLFLWLTLGDKLQLGVGCFRGVSVAILFHEGNLMRVIGGVVEWSGNRSVGVDWEDPGPRTAGRRLWVCEY